MLRIGLEVVSFCHEYTVSYFSSVIHIVNSVRRDEKRKRCCPCVLLEADVRVEMLVVCFMMPGGSPAS